MSITAFAVSGAELPKGWTLQCNVNRSESLYLYSKAEKSEVWYSYFLRGAEALKVERFDVFRCPGCSAVKAKHADKIYKLSTSGQFNEGKFEVVGTLTVNRGRPMTIPCFKNDWI